MTLPKLTGTSKQVEWANQIREKACKWLWEQGFHGTVESYEKDCGKLPTEASWWIENGKDHSAGEAVREFLGFEYLAPAGADY